MDDASLTLQAGAAAFGDASHPTTLLLLNAIEGISDQFTPESIADIGCGSGILSLRAAQLWPDARILASDLERRAVEATQANALANGVLSITALHADGFRDPAFLKAAPFDLILMNILAEPILQLLADAERYLAKGGVLMLSGMLEWQQQPIIEAARGLGLELSHRFKQADWVAQLWQKPEE